MDKPHHTPSMDEPITRGTDNVLADLALADAGEAQTKLHLALAINRIIARLRLNQTKAAALLGITQPKISVLAAYKLDGFSVERLMTFLTALDQDVDITVRAKPLDQPCGRISVHAVA